MTVSLFRGLFYVLTLLIPLVEPAVLVSYDPSGLALYFLLIPLAAFLGSRRGGRAVYLWAGAVCLYLFLFSGLNRQGFVSIFMAAYAFFTTRLVKFRGLGRILYGEPFFLAFVHYRLLLFTLSSPEMADRQQPFGAVLFFVTVTIFFFYSLLLYFTVTRRGAPALKSILALSGAALGVCLFAFLISGEGALHKMIPENLNDPLVNDFEMMDLTSESPLDQGNMRGNNDSERPGDQPGQGERPGSGQEPGDTQGKLLGIPGKAWDQAQQGDGDGEDGDGEPPRQYAVMVVESPRDSTYLAGAYHGIHDYERGFVRDFDNYLNNLANQRYLETWKNNEEIPLLTDREAVKVSVMSVEPGRAVPYYPYTLEPVVNNVTYYPFVYSWNSLSLIYNDNWNRLFYLVRNYEDIPEEISPYVDLDLTDEDLARLDALLDQAGLEGAGPVERVFRILSLYQAYQYNVGFTEDWTTEHTLDFLFRYREGDCTEFSNGAALLMRRAGVPTRVVTGYLAGEGLQNSNHKRGLLMLQQQIPLLAEKDLDDLFLVTTAHRHAWIQCWFPRVGWVDLETTDNAMPPVGMGDANQRDVVIPVITETIRGERRFEIPWRAMVRFLLWAVMLLTLSLYLFKAAYLVLLNRAIRGAGERGVKALYRKTTLIWTDRGHPPRRPDQTPREYAREQRELEEATALFNRVLYGGLPEGSEEYGTLLAEFQRSCRETLKRDNRPLKGLRQILSLKGVFHGVRSV